ncbi:MAG: DUF1850 domain-containing protein [Proteocatella sp.]
MRYNKQMGLRVLSVLLLILLLLFVPFLERLNLKTRDGEFIESYSLENSDYFDVKFRHSVNKGMVIERYELDKENKLIYLKSGWFESYGVGMMDTLDETMKMVEDGDMYRIDFAQNKVKSVNYASAGIARHVFTYGKNEISFYEVCPYKTINISIGNTNYFEIIKLFIKNKPN